MPAKLKCENIHKWVDHTENKPQNDDFCMVLHSYKDAICIFTPLELSVSCFIQTGCTMVKQHVILLAQHQ